MPTGSRPIERASKGAILSWECLEEQSRNRKVSATHTSPLKSRRKGDYVKSLQFFHDHGYSGYDQAQNSRRGNS
jgi:hypothetical protein